jgi:hypothetical protein
MSMVVANLHLGCITSFPTEADAPPVVDPNGVPTESVSLKGFKTVARKNPEIG